MHSKENHKKKEKKLSNGSFSIVSSQPSPKPSAEDKPPWEDNAETDVDAVPEDRKAPVSVHPAATPEAEAIYKTFMAALMRSDLMLGMQLQLSSSHWCDDEMLNICFDKSKRSNYNYTSSADIKQKLRKIAAESIAPYSVDILLGDDTAQTSDLPKELFGVEIVKE